MTAADSPAPADPAPTDAPSYAPYAQLAKMLVPSSGCIAIYDVDGELTWCSDGFERPDLRELVESLRTESESAPANHGAVRRTSTGVTAFVSPLRNGREEPLGFVTVELGTERAAAGTAVAQSLLRPVLECLASRISLEQTVPAETTIIGAHDLDFLIGVNQVESAGPEALQQLVNQCVRNMGCVCAAFIVPDRDVTVIANRGDDAAPSETSFLNRTQKHLLAWAQLNDRPMVVNRIGDHPDAAPYKILSCPVRDEKQRVTGLMALFRDADEPNFELRDVRMLECLARKAFCLMNESQDSLTGLMNRLAFDERLQKLVETQDTAGALLYADIDRLQTINDAFGFQAGDEVIQRVAELIRGALSPSDIACRIAGDRFAVFLSAKTEEEATALAAELKAAVSRLGYLQSGQAVPVAISIGIAPHEPGVRDAGHLQALAELACKEARQEGGNRYAVYAPNEKLSPRRESELIAAASLQHALQRNEFRLLAQPVVEIGGGATVGFEVLLRMRDASGNLTSPDKFVDAARRYRLMPAVDRWVITAAIAELTRQSAAAELPLGIAFNVSEQSLLSADYRQHVLDELKTSGLPGSLFCFELSESVAVNRLAAAEAFIAALHAAGARVALDRFGSGLTSLTHLRHLDVDHLKIDGDLIRQLPTDRHMESLVIGLTRAAESLGIGTIAEHVENSALAERLREIGVGHAQGYFYGRPRPLARALAAGAEPETKTN